VRFIFIERSGKVSKATRMRRIEPVQRDVLDVADEVADELKRRFSRTLHEWKATQSDEQGSS
jgi:hypothetical protein